jgi:ABC-type Fe3+ transport system substrate-binding protein
MHIINKEINILTLAERYPELVAEFEKMGMGSYFKKDNLERIGRYTQLGTLLKTAKIDAHLFIQSLNKKIEAREQILTGEKTRIQPLMNLMAMLPCGLRNPFKEFLDAHLIENKTRYEGLKYQAEGNVNHELSYYPKLDKVQSISEMPDIMIASDVNNFFHRPFMERFVEKGYFQTFYPYIPNPYLEKCSYADPSGNFTMFTSNMLVMAVDKTKLGNASLPQKWEDILAPAFEQKIVMRGEDEFFCNAIMLPLFKDAGFDAIRAIAHNIKTGKHPSEMVKMAESGKEEASVYIMPYFFAKKIKSPNVELVWPTDGAITSPVFMLVKKEALDKHRALLNFLLSKEMGDMLVDRHFPSIHPDVDNSSFPAPVKWLGWDFLGKHDVGKLKNEIQDVFMAIWKK